MDKREVTRLCNRECVTMWLDAAEVCQLTYMCPFKPNTQLSCRKPNDIGMTWKQCSGPDNCKRMAFIFDYYGTEVYRRALNKTHQDACTQYVMATMGIVFDVPPAEMSGGQKTCLQQRYSYCANLYKNNILRAGWNNHHVRVNLEQGKTQTKKHWKRPKEVFFNSRINLVGQSNDTIVEKVGQPRCRNEMTICG